jgi:RNA polymerase sigma factor (sigma-70 family)
MAWEEWQEASGAHILMRFVRARNFTCEADEDIIQDALLTAYLGVESGRYQPREGVPFAAYVIGIARNKLREARRRDMHLTRLDETEEETGGRRPASLQRQPEQVIERREQREQLRTGVDHLTGARRAVIEQSLAGISTGEIAGQLAISEALVRQHRCRGARALRQALDSAQPVRGDRTGR